MPPQFVFSMRDVTKIYGEKVILRDISLSFFYGAKIGIVGENGSGKTALTRIVIDELIKDKIYEAALITHPQLTPVQFIQEIIYQLKIHLVRPLFLMKMNIIIQQITS